MGKALTVIFVFGAFFVSASLSGDYVGTSSTCVRDQCTVIGSSSFGSLIVSLVMIAFLVLRPDLQTAVESDAVVGVRRRLGAFFIDFALVLIIISPIAALPLLIAEASHTGTFEWSFVRQFSRPGDGLLVFPGIFGSFAALYFYFFYYPWKGRQTVGEYVLGFRIVAAESTGLSPNYGMRPFTSFVGLCAWPISLYFALQKEDKRFWWDTDSRTRAVMVASSPGD